MGRSTLLKRFSRLRFLIVGLCFPQDEILFILYLLKDANDHLRGVHSQHNTTQHNTLTRCFQCSMNSDIVEKAELCGYLNKRSLYGRGEQKSSFVSKMSTAFSLLKQIKRVCLNEM